MCCSAIVKVIMAFLLENIYSKWLKGKTNEYRWCVYFSWNINFLWWFSFWQLPNLVKDQSRLDYKKVKTQISLAVLSPLHMSQWRKIETTRLFFLFACLLLTADSGLLPMRKLHFPHFNSTLYWKPNSQDHLTTPKVRSFFSFKFFWLCLFCVNPLNFYCLSFLSVC